MPPALAQFATARAFQALGPRRSHDVALSLAGSAHKLCDQTFHFPNSARPSSRGILRNFGAQSAVDPKPPKRSVMRALLTLLAALTSNIDHGSACNWFGKSGTVPLARPDAWLADSMLKVFPETPRPSTQRAYSEPAGAEVCLAQHEHQSFQVAIRPSSAMSTARLVSTASDPALTVTVSLVVPVNVSVAINSQNQRGLFPDALPAQPAKGAALPAGITTAFWITVTSTTSGNFSIGLQLASSDASGMATTEQLGTVAVTVLAFAIPPANSSSFLSDAGIEFSPFFLWAKTPETERAAVVKGLYAQLAEYRINRLVSCDGVVAGGGAGLHLSPPPLPSNLPRRTENSDASANVLIEVVSLDELDEMIALVLGLGFKAFALPDIAGCGPVLSKPHAASPTDTWLFNGTSYPIFEKKTAAAAAAATAARSGATGPPPAPAKLSGSFVAAFKTTYGALYAHLESKGWAQHARAIFLDEPSGGTYITHTHPVFTSAITACF